MANFDRWNEWYCYILFSFLELIGSETSRSIKKVKKIWVLRSMQRWKGIKINNLEIYSKRKRDQGVVTYSPELLSDSGSNPRRLAVRSRSKPLRKWSVIYRTHKNENAKYLYMFTIWIDVNFRNPIKCQEVLIIPLFPPIFGFPYTTIWLWLRRVLFLSCSSTFSSIFLELVKFLRFKAQFPLIPTHLSPLHGQ